MVFINVQKEKLEKIVKKEGALEWIPSFVRALPHREIGRGQVINHTSLSVTIFFFFCILLPHTY